MTYLQDYFSYYEKYSKQYNPVIIFMGLGIFYEAYVKNEADIKYMASLLDLDIIVANRKGYDNLYVIGFPYDLSKEYINKLLDNDIHVVLINKKLSGVEDEEFEIEEKIINIIK